MAVEQISLDEFRALIDQSRVECLLCGAKVHSIISHLAQTHDMSAGAYQQQFPRSKFPNAKLASPIIQELMARLGRVAQPDNELSHFVKLFNPAGNTDGLFSITASNLPPVSDEARKVGEVPELDPFFEFDADPTSAILYAIGTGKNVYIEGPTGCGKTELLKQTMGRLDRPLLRVNMHGDVTRASFVGQMRADPQRGTWFMRGALPATMQAGLPLLVDEVDYTPPHIGAVMNSVLERSRTLFIEETGEAFSAQRGFQIFATANTGGKGDALGNYTGTEILNTAFLDRFPVKLTMDYLPEDREVSMLKQRFPKENQSDVELLVRLANEIRTGFKQAQLSVTFSTRKLIEATEMRSTFGVKRALELTFLNWMDNDDRDMVIDIIDRVGIKGFKS